MRKNNNLKAKTYEPDSDVDSESNHGKIDTSSSDNDSEISISKDSASSDFKPDILDDRKEKRMMNMKLKEKRVKEKHAAKLDKKVLKREAKREAKIQKQKETRLLKEKEKEEEKQQRRSKLRQLDNMRSNSNKNEDDEKSKQNNFKVESNPNIKIIKTESSHVVKDFVDFKNPILEELDREIEDEDVVFVKQNENLKFIREVPNMKKYGLHDDDDDVMRNSPKNSQKHEQNRHHKMKTEVTNRKMHKPNVNHKMNTSDDDDQMITPKHKKNPIGKNNNNNKPMIKNKSMNRFNNDSQFKSTHKSIDTTSTPDEIKLYKRVNHIAEESFKDRYCNLLKDLQTRISWEKEKLHEQFKTK